MKLFFKLFFSLGLVVSFIFLFFFSFNSSTEIKKESEKQSSEEISISNTGSETKSEEFSEIDKNTKFVESLSNMIDKQIRISLVKSIKLRNAVANEKSDYFNDVWEREKYCKEIIFAEKLNQIVIKKNWKDKTSRIQNIKNTCFTEYDKYEQYKLKAEKEELNKIEAHKELIRQRTSKPFILFKQKKDENTCVIDNLSIALEYETWKKLDKKEIYSKMWKKVWEFWKGWLYWIWKYGWFMLEIDEPNSILEFDNKYYETKSLTGQNIINSWKSFNYVGIRRDYVLFQEVSWYKLWRTPNIEYAIWMMNAWKPVVMEVPMSLLYDGYADSNLFHAITLYRFDEKTKEFIYLNTLSWKIERLPLSKIEYPDDKHYSLYIMSFFTNLD